MKAPTPAKTARCAIYTRKSTDHNLDLEFNSLDAQREACEAYIKSQAHEGWRLLPDHFDDGGLSGASLERPALKSLLALIEKGQVDVIVVYKVDRLTRSLADFAKLVDLFDAHGVSFVSITQAFNTTTSMGRLTLNVLLSFAQFEREVIGERVRDKIAASKRKGIWVGGSVPLGYASVNKKIVIVQEDAQTVRKIFQRYLELRSVRLLADDLDKQGIKTKQRQLTNGRSMGGGRFGGGALAHLLKNRFYISEISYRGEIHSSEHEPIVDRETFALVQNCLAANNVERKLKLKSNAPILAGRIYDDRGNAMVPSHSKKNGVRYRYYVSSAVLQKRDMDVGAMRRVSGPDIEALLLSALRNYDTRSSENHADNVELWEMLEQVVVNSSSLEISLIDGTGPDKILTLPWDFHRAVAEKGVLNEPLPDLPPVTMEARDGLLAAIAKAQIWLREILRGSTIADIAAREDRVERHVRLLLSLAFVSPQLVEQIHAGKAPHRATITGLAKALPLYWAHQYELLR